MDNDDQQGGALAAEAGKKVASLAKKAITGAAAAPLGGPIVWVGGLFVVVFLVLIPIFVIAILSLSLGGGEISSGTAPSPVEPAPPTGDGNGLVGDYCIKIAIRPPPYPSAPTDEGKCSQEFRKLLEAAADWAKMPAGVLAGVASMEGPQMFGYTDVEILAFSQPNAEDPYNNSSPNNNAIDNCNVSGAGAMGPMQFMPGTWNGGGDRYHEAVNIATNEGRNEDVCNIKDAIYAASWMLKFNSGGVPAEECNSGQFTKYDYDDANNDWEGPPGAEGEEDGSEGEVYRAARSYLGACEASGVTYCLNVWDYYQATKDTGASGGPWGWPTTGVISMLPFEELNGQPHHKSDIDIAFSGGGKPVYATQDGQIYKDTETNGCGIYVVIFGSQYATFYCHLEKYSPCIEGLNNNAWIKTGTYLGDMGWTGWVEPKDPTGAHLHYQIREDDGVTPLTLEEFNSLLPTAYNKWDNVNAGYSGEECLVGP